VSLTNGIEVFNEERLKKVKDISGELLLPNGKLKLLSYKDYQKFEFDDLRIFCHQYARYGLPTIELINYLNNIIKGRSCIEIGSGHGDLGYHLKIPMTDNKAQLWPIIRKHYERMGQPIIDYPDDIEELDALEAVTKYNPKVVIGSWVTTYSPTEKNYSSSPFGIKEDKILNYVETLILIGNLESHGKKPILKFGHLLIKDAPFIVSRAKKQKYNVIYVWG